MEQARRTQFFLGANSEHGFHSLYGGFPPPGELLHIIKAGPGTGKSTFMRRLGAAAEAAGHAVEYILCSGDPDSLDGVHIPALGVAWVDGTAPHALDPGLFGADGDYVNLGQFCDLRPLRERREEIAAVTAAYKARYAAAYRFTTAAGQVDRAMEEETADPALVQRAIRRAESAVRRELGKCRSTAPGTVAQRFVGALTCAGPMLLTDTVCALCSRVYLVEGPQRSVEVYLRTLSDAATAAGQPQICCPDPLRPDILQALLLPQQGAAFLTVDAPEDLPVSRVHLPAGTDRDLRRRLRRQRAMKAALLAEAVDCLSQAKALHDRLEHFYRPCLDVAALDTFTRSILDAF